MHAIRFMLAAGIAVAAMAYSAAAQAQQVGTAFTYQGLLLDNGQPANGTHNMVFRMYDAEAGGTLKGTCPPSGTLSVEVHQGLFMAPLDYGNEMFEGDKCWLEIEVNGETIAPRQEMTPAPYALALPGLYTQQNATSPNIIGGYSGNTVSPGVVGATIAGGGASESTNTLSADFATIGGGWGNMASALGATVAGGGQFYNGIYFCYGGANNGSLCGRCVGGPMQGELCTGPWDCEDGVCSPDPILCASPGICSDFTPGNRATGMYGTIGGGANNQAGDYATISGGMSNTVIDSYGTIGGGSHNTASGWSATVGGGYENTASLNYATVSGGYINSASGFGSTAGGGGENRASGHFSTVPGGYLNQAGGDFSFAAGYQGKVRDASQSYDSDGDEGTFVWADSTDPSFWSTGPNQFLIRATGGVGIGTNSPTEQLDVAGNIHANGTVRSGSSITVDGTSGNEKISSTGALEIWVGTGRGLRIENSPDHPNIIGSASSVAPGLVGVTIAGGGGNQVTDGNWATIGGGLLNNAASAHSTIAGGAHNVACFQSTVGGGWGNNSCGVDSTIGGGQANSVVNGWATIGGGLTNSITGEYAMIGGGLNNQADGQYGTVGGGHANIASGSAATISGGQENNAGGSWAAVGGGEGNTVSGDHATVSGGKLNSASGAHPAVAGGLGNTASGQGAAVGGGEYNTADGISVTVAGGGWNTATGLETAVGGGQENSASSDFSTVGGGLRNTASGMYSAVGGGQMNTASALAATVGGGNFNSATEVLATVSGGNGNTASGTHTAIAGGDSNTGSGHSATVPGGSFNQAGGDFSFAAGLRAKVRDAGQSGDASGDEGTFVWADASGPDFVSTGANQFLIRASGGTKIYSNFDANVGVQLAPGGNAWSAISDRNVKENVKALDALEVLDRLAAVPVTQWNLISQDPSIRHIGPMAQDFHAAFGLGEMDTHISSCDADGVALAAIQGLYQIVKEKDCEIQTIRTEKDAQIANIESRLAALERLVWETHTNKTGGVR